MGLKDAYVALEDKWYGFLDRVDAHIPIYKIVDPIDRVVPSLLLFIAVIVALLAFFLIMPGLPMTGQVCCRGNKQQGNRC